MLFFGNSVQYSTMRNSCMFIHQLWGLFEEVCKKCCLIGLKANSRGRLAKV